MGGSGEVASLSALQLPRVGALFVLVAMLRASVSCGRPQATACPDPAIYYLPAGSCMNPSTLEVSGDRERVEAAIARHKGSILFTTQVGHHVTFPEDDPVALDRIKDDLTRAGLDVQYSFLIDLQ